MAFEVGAAGRKSRAAGSNRRRRDDDHDEEAAESDVRPPPDGGWGWVVVFASFMIHVVADGVTYTFGIFFVQFVHYYEAGYASTSFIASILVGTTLCCGPIASALTNRYGCRAITIAGSIISTLGFVASLWAPNVTTLYFTIGLCVGIGFGLIYLPAIVSVTCYFERWRAFATGIAVCGSGLGTFLLAPVIEHLTVRVYGWKGAMLIVAGLCLNCAVFGSLFRSPDAGRTKRSRVKGKSSKRLHRMKIPLEIEVCRPRLALSSIKRGDDFLVPVLKTPSPGGGSGSGSGMIRRSVTAQGQLSIDHLDSEEDIDDENNRIKRERPTIVWSALNLERAVADSGDGGGGDDVAGSVADSTSLHIWNVGGGSGKQTTTNTSLLTGPLYRKDIFYGGSLLNIPQYRSNPSMYTASVIHIPAGFSPSKATRPSSSVDNKSRPLSRSHDDDHDADDNDDGCGSLGGCLAREMRDALVEMTDLSLLKDNVFLLFAVSNFLTSIGFNVPYVYIKDRALLLGVSGENSSFLLAIIGVSNTVSRVLLGYLSDKSWVNRLWLYGSSLTVCGLATALSSLCLDYPSLVLYAAVFGATAGAYVGLTSVILVDLLGLEKLTNAFGLLLLFQGFASLIGPPIAGWLYDSLQSYDPGFYVAGCTISLSGLMLFSIPFVRSMSNGRTVVVVEEDGSPPITIESGFGSEDDDSYGGGGGGDDDDESVSRREAEGRVERCAENNDDGDAEDEPLEMIISAKKKSSTDTGLGVNV